MIWTGPEQVPANGEQQRQGWTLNAVIPGFDAALKRHGIAIPRTTLINVPLPVRTALLARVRACERGPGAGDPGDVGQEIRNAPRALPLRAHGHAGRTSVPPLDRGVAHGAPGTPCRPAIAGSPRHSSRPANAHDEHGQQALGDVVCGRVWAVRRCIAAPVQGTAVWETQPSAFVTDILGYARVSTGDQDVAGQTMRLTQAGAIKVFTDVRSGRSMDRPGLQDLLAYARKGDTLAVVRLDRLGRSLGELLTTVTMLKERGIALLSLEEKIDTSSAAGGLVFHVFGAIAHFERRLIAERTKDGIAAARAKGKRPGRQPLDADRIAAALKLVAAGLSPTAAARQLGLGRSTVYREVSRAGVERHGSAAMSASPSASRPATVQTA